MKNTTRLAVAAGILALGGSILFAVAQENSPSQRGPSQRPPDQRDQAGLDQRGPGTDSPRGPGMRTGQGGQGGQQGQPAQRPMIPPVIAALDANHDGVIDEKEIANASAALKTLDKNKDGKLTREELMGQPRQMGGVQGGQFRGPGNAGPGDFRPDGPPEGGRPGPGNFRPQGRGPGGPGGNFPPQGAPPGEDDGGNPPTPPPGE